MHTYLDRKTLERSDFADCCLFTGVVPAKETQEHVIPKWMIVAHDLHHRRLEMGSPSAIAKMREFRVKADADSNELFGAVENRISLGTASLDEIHLWHKKISAGMTLRHWALSRNTRNPMAPFRLDEAAAPMVLMDFQSDFDSFRQGAYVRTGSTISMDSPTADGWLAHVIGSVRRETEHNFQHRPFALVGTSVCRTLHVSMLHDLGRDFEKAAVAECWQEKLSECESVLKLQGALAGALTTVVDEWAKQLNGGTLLQSMYQTLAYQLGVEISNDGAWRARQ